MSSRSSGEWTKLHYMGQHKVYIYTRLKYGHPYLTKIENDGHSFIHHDIAIHQHGGFPVGVQLTELCAVVFTSEHVNIKKFVGKVVAQTVPPHLGMKIGTDEFESVQGEQMKCT